MFCTNCGSPNQTDRFCDQCGTELNPVTITPPEVVAPEISVEATPATPQITPSQPQQAAVATTAAPGQKNLALAWGLAVFLGNLGVDRFYLGKITSGVIKLLTLGGFGIWTFIDVITLAFNKTKDKNGNELFTNPSQRKLVAWLTLPFLFISFIIWSLIYARISR